MPGMHNTKKLGYGEDNQAHCSVSAILIHVHSVREFSNATLPLVLQKIPKNLLMVLYC